MSNIQAQASEKLAAIAKKQRLSDKLNAELNEKITALKTKFDKKLLPLNDQLNDLQSDLKQFAEEHKDDLLEAGKKSIKLASGELGWSAGKDKLVINAKLALPAIKSADYHRFIVLKETIDKAALTKELEIAESIEGVEVVPASDNFWAKPL